MSPAGYSLASLSSERLRFADRVISWARSGFESTGKCAALLKTIVDPNTPASVRVRASECVLNHGLRALEVEDIEARVAELERAAQLTGAGQPK